VFDHFRFTICNCGYGVTAQSRWHDIVPSHLASACYSSLHLAEEYTHDNRAGIQARHTYHVLVTALVDLHNSRSQNLDKQIRASFNTLRQPE
jgi:hypothetical protein